MNNERIYYSHEAEIHMMRIRALMTLIFLSFGLAIGAGLALLFAPASGKVTRHDLAKNVEEAMHSGREKIKPMMQKAQKEFSELHEKMD